jgi:hypothetical protein
LIRQAVGTIQLALFLSASPFFSPFRRYADKAFEQEYYDQNYADRVKRAQKQSSAATPKEELETEAVS